MIDILSFNKQQIHDMSVHLWIDKYAQMARLDMVVLATRLNG